MRTAEYQAARRIRSWIDAAQGAASTWASSPLAPQLSLS